MNGLHKEGKGSNVRHCHGWITCRITGGVVQALLAATGGGLVHYAPRLTASARHSAPHQPLTAQQQKREGAERKAQLVLVLAGHRVSVTGLHSVSAIRHAES